MSSRTPYDAYAGRALGGATLAVLGLLAARPDLPVLVQVLVVVAAALLASPVIRVVPWRQRREIAAGERFGNRLLERLRETEAASLTLPES